MTTKTTESGTKTREGRSTREAILEAASRLIHVHGYNHTSLDDVLRESNVGKGNFYYHFKSKEELGYAILDQIIGSFLERTLEPCFSDPQGRALTQIRCFLDRVLEMQRERNCVGGCPLGNLALELSDVHEGFRGDEALSVTVRAQGMTVMDRSKSDGDAALVEALRREDPEAPEQLVETYGDRVYRLALRITGSNEDAEEAAQDALWTAARKISTFKGESAFGSWLYRIAANAAYQKLRARRPSKTHEIAIDEVLPAFDDDGRHFEPMADWSDRVDEQALQGELRRVLGSAIDGLPPDYRTALVLHDVEGLSNPDIAEALGISLPAVKSRVHRSRLFVRKQLADYMKTA